VSEDVSNRDVVEDGLIEVLDQLEREVPDYLLDQRGCVHHDCIAFGSNELPVAHNPE
jgi:hypothetical protein